MTYNLQCGRTDFEIENLRFETHYLSLSFLGPDFVTRTYCQEVYLAGEGHTSWGSDIEKGRHQQRIHYQASHYRGQQKLNISGK